MYTFVPCWHHFMKTGRLNPVGLLTSDLMGLDNQRKQSALQIALSTSVLASFIHHHDILLSYFSIALPHLRKLSKSETQCHCPESTSVTRFRLCCVYVLRLTCKFVIWKR